MRVGGKTPICKFARSMSKDFGPNMWNISPNDNLNGKINNTFIWWNKENDSELFYRNKEGKLFTVNFESWENKNDG